ncbi:MAG: phosphate acyltransferase PlsX [Acidobacteriota bacterium]
MTTPRIVVDGVGGDHGAPVVVEGALRAAEALGVGLLLVGPEEELRREAEQRRDAATLASLDVEYLDAQEVITMEDPPLAAIKRKRRSSIVLGLKAVREGRGQAFFSAGNTGAVMAAATLILRRLPGVERAALAATLPSRTGESIVLDVGASIEKKASHLEQFAIMGACFHQALHGAQPRVALLSVGEEEGKGDEVIKQAHQALKEASVEFIGNIDGKQVFTGEADVIVTDGFTGNAILKTSESLMSQLVLIAKEEVGKSWMAKLGALLMAPRLRRLKKRFDHDEHGAVPLLGISAPVFIGHGSSSVRGIESAIAVTHRFVEQRVNLAIQEQLRALAPADEPAVAGAGDGRESA